MPSSSCALIINRAPPALNSNRILVLIIVTLSHSQVSSETSFTELPQEEKNDDQGLVLLATIGTYKLLSWNPRQCKDDTAQCQCRIFCGPGKCNENAKQFRR